MCCGLKAHLEEWRHGALYAHAVASPIPPLVGHEVSNQAQVARVDPDPVGVEDCRDLSHDCGPGSLDAVAELHDTSGFSMQMRREEPSQKEHQHV